MKTTKKMEATKTMETTKVMRTIYLLFISLFLLAGNLPAQDWANLKQFQNDNAAEYVYTKDNASCTGTL